MNKTAAMTLAPKGLEQKRKPLVSWKFLAAHAVLLFAVFSVLSPLSIILGISLKTNQEFLLTPLSFPTQPQWGNFAEAWTRATMGVYLKNSILYALVVGLGTASLGVIAAYPIARGHVRGANFIYGLLLSGLFLPTSLVALLLLMKGLNLINTYHGYILLSIAKGLSFAVFILVGFVRGIPKTLDEAAAIDGCGYFRYIFQFVFPLSIPAISTVALIAAIGTWNDFLGPYLFLYDKGMRPLTAGLYIFFGSYSTEWTILSAALIVLVAPIVVAYLFLQRFIISGAMSGAVKG